MASTGVQLQGVLDDLFAYDGELGVIYDDQGNPPHRSITGWGTDPWFLSFKF